MNIKTINLECLEYTNIQQRHPTRGHEQEQLYVELNGRRMENSNSYIKVRIKMVDFLVATREIARKLERDKKEADENVAGFKYATKI